LFTRRRDRGEESLVNLTLRNLFGGRGGRSAARSPARPTRGARLSVERLDERTVPAAFNIVPYTFTMPGVGSFHATFEDFTHGYFGGSFTDLKSGITDHVSGQLVHLQGSYDHIVFVGEGQKSSPIETELVRLDGLLYEGPPPQIRGVLTEAYTLYIPPAPPLHWTVTQPFNGIA
jgi:hypothetical protein